MAHPVPHRSTLGVLLTGVLLLAVAATAGAQGGPGFHLGISGGVDIPMEEQADVYDVGWNGTLMFIWNFGTSPFGLRLDGSYHQLSLKEELDPLFLDARTQLIDGTLDFTFGPHVCGWFQPYILAGGGIYSARFRADIDDDDDIFGDWRSPQFGWNAGLGFAFKVAPESDFHVFVEGRYQQINIEDRFSDVLEPDRCFKMITVNTGIVF